MSYAIAVLKEELDRLKSNVEWVENPAVERCYKDDDEADLKRWKKQISELEDAVRRLG